MRHRLWLVLVIPPLLLALAGCEVGLTPQKPADQFSSTAIVTRETMADVVQAAGQVVSQDARVLSYSTAGGRVLEVKAKVGQFVRTGQLLVRLDTADQERQLREAQGNLKMNEAALAVAQRGATAAELAKAEADVAQAEADLPAAMLKLNVAQQYGLVTLEDTVADARFALQAARTQLRMKEIEPAVSTMRALEYSRDYYQRALRDSSLAQDRSKTEASLADTERSLASQVAAHDEVLHKAADEVAKAEDTLEKAVNTLERAKAGLHDQAAAARLAREQAFTNMEKARLKLSELKRGADSAAIKAAQRNYEGAVARVETVKAQIATANLTAPYDGVVLAVYVRVDDRVKPRDRIVYMADLKDLRVRAQISELDVAGLAAGQIARLTFDAYPGRIFGGEILLLPVQGKDAGGVSVFEVEASLRSDNADLRPGMLANMRVVIGEKKDVLAIPAVALQYRPPKDTVVLLRDSNGTTREQKVQVGINDGIMAEIQSGLQEGQVVLIPLAPSVEPRRTALPVAPGKTPVQPQPQPGQPSGGQPQPGQPSGGQPQPGQPSGGQPQPGQPSGGQPQPQPGQPSGGQPQPQPGQPSGGRP